MTSRRKFLKMTTLGAAGAAAGLALSAKPEENVKNKPIVISTWNHGLAANEAAWDVLNKGGSALDAVEKGVRVTESDPKNSSVGLGGLPDREGNVTLDACIMDENSNCGAVAFLEHIENPISVARKVMEKTPHVMFVGAGALQFAEEQGFKRANLLTESSKKAWKKWLEKSKYEPVINSENHDTIGQLALDANGNLSGACTTSGMAYKMRGRVGDSPIIGAGLFVDNEVGAACATGMGEAIVRLSGSSIVVELMRQGYTPDQACKEVVDRIIKKHSDLRNLQVGLIALDKNGNAGGYSVYAGFNYALKTKTDAKMVNTKFNRNW
jgi:isoaspartyl peptidase/L-asparaginase-like protein (Ntn-hydrolase superfamily)